MHRKAAYLKILKILNIYAALFFLVKWWNRYETQIEELNRLDIVRWNAEFRKSIIAASRTFCIR